jgi:hypothetical protein
MADKKKLCLVLGPISATKTEQRASSGWLRRDVIEPVMAENFPEYEFRRMTEFDNQEANMADVLNADLVIADLSTTNPNTLFELGLRHSTLLPTVHMASEEETEIAYFDLTLFHIIKFTPRKDPEATRRALKNAIDQALADNPSSPARPRSDRRELVQRLEIVTTAIANLRINSLSEHIDELREISEELKHHSDSENEPTSVRDIALRALPILTHLFDALGSKQGAQVIIAGAVTGILGAGGMSSATIFALTLAVWQGKDAFVAALDRILPKRKGSKTKQRKRRKPS